MSIFEFVAFLTFFMSLTVTEIKTGISIIFLFYTK